jgi:hypothetical protein
MKITIISLLTFFSVTANGSDLDSTQWKKLKTEKFEIIYPSGLDVSETLHFLEKGTEAVEHFFGQPFHKKFSVKIFTERNDLDKFWRTDWNAPDFNSECWMVASGDANGIAMLATSAWKVQACEHDPADKIETKKLLTHELTHVFHSQWQNAGANEDLEPIGWFVEGLATYVSGQLDDRRMSRYARHQGKEKFPMNLKSFGADKLAMDNRDL